tara:strand:- start:28 stop:231 length:204 start_codon:yes stop_codon:yes gene_type:complete
MDINRIISKIRSLKEDAPTNSVGDGSATSLPPSVEPGVKKKKRNPTPVGRYGTRRTWSQFLKVNGKS